MPKFIASGYFVYSQSLVHVCDEYQRVRKRFEGPTHYKRNVSVKLSSIDPLNQGVVLPWCEDVRSIEIDPLTNGAHKRKFFSLKFYHSVNDQGKILYVQLYSILEYFLVNKRCFFCC